MNKWPLVIHGNGPAKNSEKWKEILDIYESHTKLQQKMNGDLTILTWSIIGEEFLLDKVMTDMGCKESLNVIPLEKVDGEINWTDKITKTLQFIKGVDTKYVMGMDALDVIPNSDEAMSLWNDIIKLFDESGCDILFNGEQYNWPSSDGHGTILPEEHPLVVKLKEVEKFDAKVYGKYFESQWCHLNSGCWIAKTESMVEFYTEVVKLIEEQEGEYNKEMYFGGDQGFIRMVAYDWFPRVAIDSRCKIFQTIAGNTAMLKVTI